MKKYLEFIEEMLAQQLKQKCQKSKQTDSRATARLFKTGHLESKTWRNASEFVEQIQRNAQQSKRKMVETEADRITQGRPFVYVDCSRNCHPQFLMQATTQHHRSRNTGRALTNAQHHSFDVIESSKTLI